MKGRPKHALLELCELYQLAVIFSGKKRILLEIEDAIFSRKKLGEELPIKMLHQGSEANHKRIDRFLNANEKDTNLWSPEKYRFLFTYQSEILRSLPRDHLIQYANNTLKPIGIGAFLLSDLDGIDLKQLAKILFADTTGLTSDLMDGDIEKSMEHIARMRNVLNQFGCRAA